MVLSTRKQRPHQFDQNYRGKTYVGIQIHAINENVGSSRTYIGYLAVVGIVTSESIRLPVR